MRALDDLDLENLESEARRGFSHPQDILRLVGEVRRLKEPPAGLPRRNVEGMVYAVLTEAEVEKIARAVVTALSERP